MKNKQKILMVRICHDGKSTVYNHPKQMVESITDLPPNKVSGIPFKYFFKKKLIRQVFKTYGFKGIECITIFIGNYTDSFTHYYSKKPFPTEQRK